MSALNVNLDLVQKYNVPGPRYTSYPPATKFTDAISWEQLSAKIDENNRTPRDLSVYFHIPFCETLCWFCGCTTVITLNHDKGIAYVETLGREMERLHKSCRRLVWLNPLLRWQGFEPRAAGIKAIMPHVDEFRPVHNLDSLEDLAEALGREVQPYHLEPGARPRFLSAEAGIPA